jgi:TonB family protein
MTCRFNLRILRAGAILALAAALAPEQLLAGSELEQHLRDQYKNKVFVLRDFPQGARLTYDSEGKLIDSADPGDWTVAGFVRVTGVDLSGQRLTIKAERLYLGVAPGMGFQLIQLGEDNKEKDAKRLRIEVAIDPEVTSPGNADAALARIFLTSQDRFADLVPDYWKPCVRAASTGKAAKGLVDCRFAPKFTTIPGVVPPPDEKSNAPEADDSEGLSGEIVHELRRENGITPPTPISQPNPPFSEEARLAKYHGTVTLSVIVDKTGQPRSIRIMRPTGMSLDRQAVVAVATWRLNPGTKDGQPVAMGPIPIQVDFHLY